MQRPKVDPWLLIVLGEKKTEKSRAQGVSEMCAWHDLKCAEWMGEDERQKPEWEPVRLQDQQVGKREVREERIVSGRKLCQSKVSNEVLA